MRLLLLLLVLFPCASPAPQARELIEKLRSEKPEERDEAVRKLRELGRAALDDLEKAAKDPDRDLADRAAHLLRFLRIEEQLTPNLKKVFPGITERLAKEKGNAWTPLWLEAISSTEDRRLKYPTLTKADLECLASRALKEEQESVEKVELLDIIRERRLRQLTDQVRGLISHPEPDVRSMAIRTLVDFDCREVIPELREKMIDLRMTERVPYFDALAEFGVREIIPLLVDGLMHTDGLVQNTCVGDLRILVAKEAVEPVRKLLTHSRPDVRERALRVLRLLHARETLPDVLACLKDREPNVRQEALGVLITFRARDQIDAIRPFLEDPIKSLRQEAQKAFLRLGVRDESVQMLLKLLDDPGSNTQLTAILELSYLGAREAIPRLLKIAGERGKYWSYAMDALGRLNAKEAIPLLRTCLEKEVPEYPKASAAAALGALEDRDSIPKLEMLLNDESDYVRIRSLWALCRLGSRGSIPKMKSLLKDPDWTNRAAVAHGLALIGAKEAIPDILELLQDAKQSVRQDAAEALCTLGSDAGIQVILDDEEGLSSLNALRLPDEVRRLEALKLDPDYWGTRKGLKAHLARAGLRVEIPPGLENDPRTEEQVYIEKTSLLAAAPTCARGAEIIVEKDHVRLVHKSDALEFWKTWNQARKK